MFKNNPFGGIHLIPDPFQSEFIIEPAKKHEIKSWMKGRRYHGRIQKKWNKRFGIKKERQMFQMVDRIIAHPNTIEWLKQNLDKYT